MVRFQGFCDVKIIERNLDNQANLIRELSAFVSEMKAATRS